MREVAGLAVFLIRTGLADGDVNVRAQVAVLHVAVTGAEIAQDLAQLAHVCGGLFGAADIRTADDFHQADAGAVEIDEGHGGVHVVDRLARVLFHVDTFDPHQAGDAGLHVHEDFAFAHQRLVKLGDLVALRQVGVEVVLAVEGGFQVDLRFEAKAGAHGLFDAEFVDDGQHAGHGGVDEGDVGIGLGAELRRGAREELGVRGHLRVDLHPDDKFPVLFRPGDHLGFRGLIGQV